MMNDLSIEEFKVKYFPKCRENDELTYAILDNVKHYTDSFHEFLVTNKFFKSVTIFVEYDNALFGFYKQVERCLKSGQADSSNVVMQWSALCQLRISCLKFLGG